MNNLITSVVIEDYTCPDCKSSPVAAIGPMRIDHPSHTLVALGTIVWICPNAMCRWIRTAADRALWN